MAGYLWVLTIYSAILIWIFVLSDGLPYGLDNNETFSNLIQGRNLLQYSSTNSFLLTDESTAGSVGGHPYLYTHGQNFPRFAAALMLLLGVTEAQTHMFLAATIGGIAVITLIFLAVKKIAGSFAATVSAAFAASSTIFFLQTAPNTWRIWQSVIVATTIFLAATILSGTDHPRLWRVAATVTAFLAVSVELTFGLAIALVLMMTSLIRRPLNRSQTWLNASAGLIGCGLGAGIFLSQLVGALGLRATVDDLRYTFSSRNRGDQAVEAFNFFQENNIAFWRNSLEIDLSSTGNLVVGFMSEFLVYGPGWFAVPLLLLGTALLFRFQKETHQSLDKERTDPRQTILLSSAVGSFASLVFVIVGETVRGGVGVIASVLIGILFGIGTYLAGYLSGSSFSPSTAAFMGVFGGMSLVLWTYIITVFVPVIPLPQVERRDLLLFAVGGSASVFLQWMKRPESSQRGVSAFARSSLCVALVSLGFIALLPATTQIIAIPVELGLRNSPSLQVFAVLAAWGIAGIWASSRERRSVNTNQNVESLIIISLLLGIAVVAVAVVYLLSPGYYVTGYSSRLVPFFGLFLPVVTGGAAAVMIQQSWSPGNSRFSNFRLSSVFVISVTVSIFAMWFLTNIILVPKLFNSDFATVYQEIQGQEPDGVVATSYPAPWAYAADTWAYLDTGLPSPPLLEQVMAGEQYVWIRDGLENPAYQSPTAAVCFSPINPSQLLMKNPEPSGACRLDLYFNANTRLRPESIVQDEDKRFLIAFGPQIFASQNVKAQ